MIKTKVIVEKVKQQYLWRLLLIRETEILFVFCFFCIINIIKELSRVCPAQSNKVLICFEILRYFQLSVIAKRDCCPFVFFFFWMVRIWTVGKIPGLPVWTFSFFLGFFSPFGPRLFSLSLSLWAHSFLAILFLPVIFLPKYKNTPWVWINYKNTYYLALHYFYYYFL